MFLKFEESYNCSKCDEDVIQIKCDSSRRLNHYNKFEKHCVIIYQIMKFMYMTQ